MAGVKGGDLSIELKYSTSMYILMTKETSMRLSAKNVLKGTVKSILAGAVNAEVVIVLPGGAEVTSVITKGSAESLGLQVGGTAYAIIKASNVILGVD